MERQRSQDHEEEALKRASESWDFISRQDTQDLSRLGFSVEGQSFDGETFGNALEQWFTKLTTAEPRRPPLEILCRLFAILESVGQEQQEARLSQASSEVIQNIFRYCMNDSRESLLRAPPLPFLLVDPRNALQVYAEMHRITITLPNAESVRLFEAPPSSVRKALSAIASYKKDGQDKDHLLTNVYLSHTCIAGADGSVVFDTQAGEGEAMDLSFERNSRVDDQNSGSYSSSAIVFDSLKLLAAAIAQHNKKRGLLLTCKPLLSSRAAVELGTGSTWLLAVAEYFLDGYAGDARKASQIAPQPLEVGLFRRLDELRSRTADNGSPLARAVFSKFDELRGSFLRLAEGLRRRSITHDDLVSLQDSKKAICLFGQALNLPIADSDFQSSMMAVAEFVNEAHTIIKAAKCLCDTPGVQTAALQSLRSYAEKVQSAVSTKGAQELEPLVRELTKKIDSIYAGTDCAWLNTQWLIGFLESRIFQLFFVPYGIQQPTEVMFKQTRAAVSRLLSSKEDLEVARRRCIDLAIGADAPRGPRHDMEEEVSRACRLLPADAVDERRCLFLVDCLVHRDFMDTFGMIQRFVEEASETFRQSKLVRDASYVFLLQEHSALRHKFEANSPEKYASFTNFGESLHRNGFGRLSRAGRAVLRAICRCPQVMMFLQNEKAFADEDSFQTKVAFVAEKLRGQTTSKDLVYRINNALQLMKTIGNCSTFAELFDNLATFDEEELQTRLSNLLALNDSLEDVRRWFLEARSKARHTSKEFLETVLQTGKYVIKRKAKGSVKFILILGMTDGVQEYDWSVLEEHRQRARFHYGHTDNKRPAIREHILFQRFSEKDEIANKVLVTEQQLLNSNCPRFHLSCGELDTPYIAIVDLTHTKEALQDRLTEVCEEWRSWTAIQGRLRSACTAVSLMSWKQLDALFRVVLSTESNLENASFRCASILWALLEGPQGLTPIDNVQNALLSSSRLLSAAERNSQACLGAVEDLLCFLRVEKDGPPADSPSVRVVDCSTGPSAAVPGDVNLCRHLAPILLSLSWKPFRVLFCSEETTVDVVTVFLVAAKTQRHPCLVVQPNKLSSHLRKELIHGLLSRDSGAEVMIIGTDSAQLSQFCSLCETIENFGAEERRVQLPPNRRIVLVEGPEGSGKTTWIERQIAEQSHHSMQAFVSVKEGFQVKDLFAQLEAPAQIAYSTGADVSVLLHVDVSGAAPVAALECLNKALLQLLYANYLYCSDSGDVLYLPASSNLTVFIERGCRVSDRQSDWDKLGIASAVTAEIETLKTLSIEKEEIFNFDLDNNDYYVLAVVHAVENEWREASASHGYKDVNVDDEYWRQKMDALKTSFTSPDVSRKELARAALEQVLFRVFPERRAPFARIRLALRLLWSGFNSLEIDFSSLLEYQRIESLYLQKVDEVYVSLLRTAKEQYRIGWLLKGDSVDTFAFTPNYSDIGTDRASRYICMTKPDSTCNTKGQIGILDVYRFSPLMWQDLLLDSFVKVISDEFAADYLSPSVKKVIIGEAIDRNEYILTPESLIDIVRLHEERRAGVSTILEGETGTGKTETVRIYAEVLSSLLHAKHPMIRSIETALKQFRTTIGDFELDAVLNSLHQYTEDTVRVFLTGLTQLQRDKGLEGVGAVLREVLRRLMTDIDEYVCLRCSKVLAEEDSEEVSPDGYSDLSRVPAEVLEKELEKVKQVLRSVIENDDNSLAHVNTMIGYLTRFLRLRPENGFLTIQMHAALDDRRLFALVDPIRTLAQKEYDRATARGGLPASFVIFIDEANTSRCLGTIKELMIDRHINGLKVPNNVYIVAAINPARRSDEVISDDQKLSAGSLPFVNHYEVNEIPPSLQVIARQFGGIAQERLLQFLVARYFRFLRSTIVKKRCSFEQARQTLQTLGICCIQYEAEKGMVEVSFPAHKERPTVSRSIDEQDIGLNLEQHGIQLSLARGERPLVCWRDVFDDPSTEVSLRVIMGAIVPNVMDIPSKLEGNSSIAKKFLEFIVDCHTKVGELLGDNAISHRNLSRLFKLWVYFTKQHLNAVSLAALKDVSTRSNNFMRPDSNEDVIWSHIELKAKMGFDEMILRSLILAISLAYYICLPEHSKGEQRSVLGRTISKHTDHIRRALRWTYKPLTISFPTTFEEETRHLSYAMEIPDGIAKNESLLENLYAIAICCDCRVPIIIIGPPGTSKSLSVRIAKKSMRGPRSRSVVLRQMVNIHDDMLFYQCSETSTSKEVEEVFDSAIARQKGYESLGSSHRVTVFLDEAGIPNRRTEALKALHYYLDHPKVGCIIVTNQPLDAAKMNRGLVLFRSPPTERDLLDLAQGCMKVEAGKPYAREVIKTFSAAYFALCQGSLQGLGSESLDKNRILFQLRDFYHFLQYFIRNYQRTVKELESNSAYLFGDDLPIAMTAQRAFQRNFGGLEREELIELYRAFAPQKYATVRLMNESAFLPTLNAVWDSLYERYRELGNSQLQDMRFRLGDQAIRFKMVLDGPGDGSALRILYRCGILHKTGSDVIIGTPFPNDEHNAVNSKVVSDMKISMESGTTAIMIGCYDVHASFYDIFNLNLEVAGRKHLAPIAIGAYTQKCEIDPFFECIVLVKASELRSKRLPLPLLNRFERFYVSSSDYLEELMAISDSSDCTVYGRAVAEALQSYIQGEVINYLGSSNFYGFCKDTLSSILIEHASCLRQKIQYRDMKTVFLKDARNCLQRLFRLLRPQKLLDSYDALSEEIKDIFASTLSLSLADILEKELQLYTQTKTNVAEAAAFFKVRKLCIYARSDQEVHEYIGLMRDHTAQRPTTWERSESGPRISVMPSDHLLEREKAKNFIRSFFLRRKESHMLVISMNADAFSMDEINAIRYFIDHYSEEFTGDSRNDGKSKTVMCILLFPSQFLAVGNIYPASFLGWDFAYVENASPFHSIYAHLKKMVERTESDQEPTAELVDYSLVKPNVDSQLTTILVRVCGLVQYDSIEKVVVSEDAGPETETDMSGWYSSDRVTTQRVKSLRWFLTESGLLEYAKDLFDKSWDKAAVKKFLGYCERQNKTAYSDSLHIPLHFQLEETQERIFASFLSSVIVAIDKDPMDSANSHRTLEALAALFRDERTGGLKRRELMDWIKEHLHYSDIISTEEILSQMENEGTMNAWTLSVDMKPSNALPLQQYIVSRLEEKIKEHAATDPPEQVVSRHLQELAQQESSTKAGTIYCLFKSHVLPYASSELLKGIILYSVRKTVLSLFPRSKKIASIRGFLENETLQCLQQEEMTKDTFLWTIVRVKVLLVQRGDRWLRAVASFSDVLTTMGTHNNELGGGYSPRLEHSFEVLLRESLASLERSFFDCPQNVSEDWRRKVQRLLPICHEELGRMRVADMASLVRLIIVSCLTDELGVSAAHSLTTAIGFPRRFNSLKEAISAIAEVLEAERTPLLWELLLRRLEPVLESVRRLSNERTNEASAERETFLQDLLQSLLLLATNNCMPVAVGRAFMLASYTHFKSEVLAHLAHWTLCSSPLPHTHESVTKFVLGVNNGFLSETLSTSRSSTQHLSVVAWYYYECLFREHEAFLKKNGRRSDQLQSFLQQISTKYSQSAGDTDLKSAIALSTMLLALTRNIGRIIEAGVTDGASEENHNLAKLLIGKLNELFDREDSDIYVKYLLTTTQPSNISVAARLLENRSKWLEEIVDNFAPNPAGTKLYELSFMSSGTMPSMSEFGSYQEGILLRTLYYNITSALQTVLDAHKAHENLREPQKALKGLLTTECSSPSGKLNCRLCLLLALYYCLYDKGVELPIAPNEVLVSQLGLSRDQKQPYIAFMTSGRSGFVRLNREDPLDDYFPPNPQDVGPDQRMRRHALVTVLATMLGAPEDRHFGYLYAFEPLHILDSYVLAMGASGRVGGGYHIDCGFQFDYNNRLLPVARSCQNSIESFCYLVFSVWSHLFFASIFIERYGREAGMSGQDLHDGPLSSYFVREMPGSCSGARQRRFIMSRMDYAWNYVENNNLLPPGQVALLFNSMSVGYMVGARDWNNHDFVRKCTSERKRDHVELYMKRICERLCSSQHSGLLTKATEFTDSAIQTQRDRLRDIGQFRDAVRDVFDELTEQSVQRMVDETASSDAEQQSFYHQLCNQMAKLEALPFAEDLCTLQASIAKYCQFRFSREQVEALQVSHYLKSVGKDTNMEVVFERAQHAWSLYKPFFEERLCRRGRQEGQENIVRIVGLDISKESSLALFLPDSDGENLLSHVIEHMIGVHNDLIEEARQHVLEKGPRWMKVLVEEERKYDVYSSMDLLAVGSAAYLGFLQRQENKGKLVPVVDITALKQEQTYSLQIDETYSVSGIVMDRLELSLIEKLILGRPKLQYQALKFHAKIAPVEEGKFIPASGVIQQFGPPFRRGLPISLKRKIEEGLAAMSYKQRIGLLKELTNQSLVDNLQTATSEDHKSRLLEVGCLDGRLNPAFDHLRPSLHNVDVGNYVPLLETIVETVRQRGDDFAFLEPQFKHDLSPELRQEQTSHLESLAVQEGVQEVRKKVIELVSLLEDPNTRRDIGDYMEKSLREVLQYVLCEADMAELLVSSVLPEHIEGLFKLFSAILNELPEEERSEMEVETMKGPSDWICSKKVEWERTVWETQRVHAVRKSEEAASLRIRQNLYELRLEKERESKKLTPEQAYDRLRRPIMRLVAANNRRKLEKQRKGPILTIFAKRAAAQTQYIRAKIGIEGLSQCYRRLLYRGVWTSVFFDIRRERRMIAEAVLQQGTLVVENAAEEYRQRTVARDQASRLVATFLYEVEQAQRIKRQLQASRKAATVMSTKLRTFVEKKETAISRLSEQAAVKSAQTVAVQAQRNEQERKVLELRRALRVVKLRKPVDSVVDESDSPFSMARLRDTLSAKLSADDDVDSLVKAVQYLVASQKLGLSGLECVFLLKERKTTTIEYLVGPLSDEQLDTLVNTFIVESANELVRQQTDAFREAAVSKAKIILGERRWTSEVIVEVFSPLLKLPLNPDTFLQLDCFSAADIFGISCKHWIQMETVRDFFQRDIEETCSTAAWASHHELITSLLTEIESSNGRLRPQTFQKTLEAVGCLPEVAERLRKAATISETDVHSVATAVLLLLLNNHSSVLEAEGELKRRTRERSQEISSSVRAKGLLHKLCQDSVHVAGSLYQLKASIMKVSAGEFLSCLEPRVAAFIANFEKQLLMNSDRQSLHVYYALVSGPLSKELGLKTIVLSAALMAFEESSSRVRRQESEFIAKDIVYHNTASGNEGPVSENEADELPSSHSRSLSERQAELSEEALESSVGRHLEEDVVPELERRSSMKRPRDLPEDEQKKEWTEEGHQGSTSCTTPPKADLDRKNDSRSPSEVDDGDDSDASASKRARCTRANEGEESDDRSSERSLSDFVENLSLEEYLYQIEEEHPQMRMVSRGEHRRAVHPALARHRVEEAVPHRRANALNREERAAQRRQRALWEELPWQTRRLLSGARAVEESLIDGEEDSVRQ